MGFSQEKNSIFVSFFMFDLVSTGTLVLDSTVLIMVVKAIATVALWFTVFVL